MTALLDAAAVAGFAALSLERLLVPLLVVLLSLGVAGLFFVVAAVVVVVVRARLGAVDGPELAAIVFAAPDFGGVLVVFSGAVPAAALAALTGLTDVDPFAAFVVFVALVALVAPVAPVDTALADPDADLDRVAVFAPRGLSGAESLAETSGTARTADRRAAFFAVGAASG